MVIAESLHAGQPALALAGRLDARNAEAAVGRLIAAAEDGRATLILDCDAVEYVGATAMRILLMLAHRAATRRITVEVVKVRPAIRRIMAAGGIDRWATTFGMRLMPQDEPA